MIRNTKIAFHIVPVDTVTVDLFSLAGGILDILLCLVNGVIVRSPKEVWLLCDESEMKQELLFYPGCILI